MVTFPFPLLPPPPSNRALTQSYISSWMMPPIEVLTRYGLLPVYFGHIQIIGLENLPRNGSLILAPTHRSRWDSLIVPYAAGRHRTGRHIRFMVSQDEVRGIQGWFIQRLGGFPIDPKQPTIASLRHGVNLLHNGEILVIFPEGNIYRQSLVKPLRPGLARLAIQSEMTKPGLGLQIVPIGLTYSHPVPRWRSRVMVNIGQPLGVADYVHTSNPYALKEAAKQLTAHLHSVLQSLVPLPSIVP